MSLLARFTVVHALMALGRPGGTAGDLWTIENILGSAI